MDYLTPYIVGILGGIAIALSIVAYIYFKVRDENTIGVLRIDTESDPYDGPYLFLELDPDSNPSLLKKRKWVILEVDPTPYLPSQE